MSWPAELIDAIVSLGAAALIFWIVWFIIIALAGRGKE